MEKRNEQAEKMGKIISQCWTDEAFKKRFIADPATVMKEVGMELPAGVEFQVVENTDQVKYILLPPKQDELNDEQLDEVTGGSVFAALLAIDGWDRRTATTDNAQLRLLEKQKELMKKNKAKRG
ncbi:MAG: NHLP leader peptide family RiPP precursor [Chitinophagales bacterium]